jgi:outer membrane protein TolC
MVTINARKSFMKLLSVAICSTLALASGTLVAEAQTIGGQASRRLTMKQTIALAQEQSISAMVSENIYAAGYWRHRSYRAGRLPSLNLSTRIGNVNRSIEAIPDPNTGVFNYVPVFRLTNDLSLYVRQMISATGGTLSVESSLERRDQFKPDNITWYSQPITLQYIQPLFSYNAARWDKKIEPQNFEAAKLEYLEAVEDVTIRATGYFWGLAMAELNRDNAVRNQENSRRLYRIARERYNIGSMSRGEVMQLELRALQDSLAIGTSEIAYAEQKNYLASFLGLREDTDIELEVDRTLPGITLDHAEVLERAMSNSSFEINSQIAILEAEQAVARARGNRGIDVAFNARFGLSQSADRFSGAYSNLRDQQVAGFTVSIPILDWGMGSGRVKMERSRAEMVRYQQEQALVDYEREIFTGVMEFNAGQAQCEGALRAKSIADERFALSVENFERGAISVLDLNTAQNEKDTADRNYIAALAAYWNSYFKLRKTTLYDFMSRTDIAAAFGEDGFDKLIE